MAVSVAAKGTTYTTGGTATTTHVVDLPNGLVAGDRVLICAGLRENTAFTWPGSPAWTSLAAVAAPTSGGRLECRYHDVDGTEGWTDGSTITITTGGSVKGVAFAWKVTGHDPATAPVAATSTNSASANPDPPSLDPSTWGTEDTLWGAVSYSNANNTTSAYPTDYVDNQENAVATGASAASARICSRSVNAASQDPSAFTISAAQNCATVTFAIRPASVPVEGSAASVIPAATQSAAGTVTVDGSAASTIAPVTQSAAGVATIEAQAASTVPAVTQSAAGQVRVDAVAASTIPAVSQSAAGVLTVQGAAASVIPAVTQAATGHSDFVPSTRRPRLILVGEPS